VVFLEDNLLPEKKILEILEYSKLCDEDFVKTFKKYPEHSTCMRIA